MKATIIIIVLALVLTACATSHNVTGTVLSKDAANNFVTIDRDGTERTIEVTGAVFNSLSVGVEYHFKAGNMDDGYRIFDSAEEVK